ncbi:MAG: hypothetical protein ACK2UK_19460, partial [Candidatus Promineifilaceae bacterium]
IQNSTQAGTQLYSLFDRTGGTADEAHLTVGDSGGAAYIYDPLDARWELAGIHYAVDAFYNYNDSGSGEFRATIFDGGGLYLGNDTDVGSKVPFLSLRKKEVFLPA